jgi:hypothetical protein
LSVERSTNSIFVRASYIKWMSEFTKIFKKKKNIVGNFEVISLKNNSSPKLAYINQHIQQGWFWSKLCIYSTSGIFIDSLSCVNLIRQLRHASMSGGSLFINFIYFYHYWLFLRMGFFCIRWLIVCDFPNSDPTKFESNMVRLGSEYESSFEQQSSQIQSN